MAEIILPMPKKGSCCRGKIYKGFFHFLAAQMWKTAPIVTETAKTLQQTFKNGDPTVFSKL
jgi:hypothetical protein